MVVAVEYISKEESADVAAGSASAKHGVTGILAVQGAFAEHAAMLDRLGAPWKLLRAAEDFDDSIDRVILPGGESTTQGKLLRSTGLFEPIAAHIAAGKPVFVNFTAAWCVTCQVNEKVALSTQGVAEAFKQTGAVYLKADWTLKDAVIEAELAKHGRAGVPLYLVYGAKGGDGVILPQILTEGLIVRALKDGQAR